MSKIFYTTHLMGGLGNQLFQLSNTICQGLKNDVGVKFKPESLISTQGNQISKYQDNIFQKIIFSNFEDPDFIIYEGEHRYNFNFKDFSPPKDKSVKFIGYFQSSKNFLGFSDVIKEKFKVSEFFYKKISNLYPEINNDKTVSIHIRRGDYLKIPNILPTIDKSYYDYCIDLFPNHTIFIFTDDKNWVKNNFTYENSILVDGLADFEELWMMSLCKNNILANSSFSWWAAFLNSNINKKILCPSVWFGPNGPIHYEDIFENEWVKIKCNFDKNKIFLSND